MRLFAQTDFTLLERELIYFIHQKTFIEVILFSLNEGGDPLFFSSRLIGTRHRIDLQPRQTFHLQV